MVWCCVHIPLHIVRIVNTVQKEVCNAIPCGSWATVKGSAPHKFHRKICNAIKIVSEMSFSSRSSLWRSIFFGPPSISPTSARAESEKPRQRVSNADRKVFANPESFCNKLIIGWRISGYFGKCPDTIQNIQIICKVSAWTGKFLDDLKSVGMNWKVSRWCK